MLYSALSNYDWSSLRNRTSVVAAIVRLNAVTTHAIDLAVSSGHTKKHYALSYLISWQIKIVVTDVTRSSRPTHSVANFLFCRKRLKYPLSRSDFVGSRPSTKI
jgi:hypothetical protein